MTDSEFHLRVLGDDETGNLRAAADALAQYSDVLKFRPDPIPVDQAESALLKDAEIVLASAPDPQIGREGSADALLSSPSVRLCLAQPRCFVLFVSADSRRAHAREVCNWVTHSKPPGGSGGRNGKQQVVECLGQLAINSPLRWSFLTRDESSNKGRFRRHAEVLSRCCRLSLFDPTGVRFLLHSIVGGRVLNTPTSFRSRYAVVADDDGRTAHEFGYFARRLGYSPIVVDTAGMCGLVFDVDEQKGPNWLCGCRPGMMLMDQYLTFGERNERGSELLERLAACNEVIISGNARGGFDDQQRAEGACARFEFAKPILGVHDLNARFYKSQDGERSVQIEALPTSRTLETHAKFLKQLRPIGRCLADQAAALNDDSDRTEKQLILLETFNLLRGFDGPAAAHAYMTLQELEVESCCDNYVPRDDIRVWSMRCEEIKGAFENAYPEGFDHEAEWWIIRTVRSLSQMMQQKAMPEFVRSLMVDSERDARERLMALRNPRPWNVIRARLLRFWLTWTTSLSRLAAVWLILLAVAFTGYLSFADRLTPGQDWSWAGRIQRSATSALAGGVGLGISEEYGLRLPNDLQYLTGMVHTGLAYLLLARLVDLLLLRANSR